MSGVRVLVDVLQVQGHMLLNGSKIPFKASVEGTQLSAEFDYLPEGVSTWEAFQAIESFINDHLRG